MNRGLNTALVGAFPYATLALLAGYTFEPWFGGALYANTQTVVLGLGIAWFVATDAAYLYTKSVLSAQDSAATAARSLLHLHYAMLPAFIGIVAFVISRLAAGAPTSILWIGLLCLVLSGTNALIFAMGPLKLCANEGMLRQEELGLHTIVQAIPFIGAVDAANIAAHTKHDNA